jgi:DNA-binding MarR family transcriptional regulator
MTARPRLRTPALVRRRPELSSLDRLRHEHLGWLLVQADRLFAEGVTRAINARGFSGIRLVHIVLVRNIAEHGTRITEIARRAGMTKSATSQLVREFVELGYIRVVPDPEDGRAKVAEYTRSGKGLLAAVVDAIAETEAACAQVIGDDEMQRLKAVLTRLLAVDRAKLFGAHDHAAAGS